MMASLIIQKAILQGIDNHLIVVSYRVLNQMESHHCGDWLFWVADTCSYDDVNGMKK